MRTREARPSKAVRVSSSFLRGRVQVLLDLSAHPSRGEDAQTLRMGIVIRMSTATMYIHSFTRKMVALHHERVPSASMGAIASLSIIKGFAATMAASPDGSSPWPQIELEARNS